MKKNQWLFISILSIFTIFQQSNYMDAKPASAADVAIINKIQGVVRAPVKQKEPVIIVSYLENFASNNGLTLQWTTHIKPALVDLGASTDLIRQVKVLWNTPND